MGDGPAETTTRHLSIEVPIRTVSESNMCEHWAAKHRRKKQQQRVVALVLRGAASRPDDVSRVRLTRLAPRRLDTDNGVSALKHVQDAVARWLGVDDGNCAITWEYAQDKSKHYAVLVELWTS